MQKIICIVGTVALLLIMTQCRNDQAAQSATEAVQQNITQEIENDISNSRSLAIDMSKSVIEWTASKPGARHNGSVKLKGGSVITTPNKLIRSEVIIDMSSIEVADLDGKDKESLEAHLKGTVEGKEADFFNVRKYPEARFATTRVIKLSNDPQYNYMVYGYLTLKDITKEIAFKADAEINLDGMELESEEFSINRTDWGIHFLSKSVFSGLKDRFINDEVRLRLSVIASADY